MLTSLPLYIVIVIFFISAFVVWIAGIKITHVTDIIDSRFHLGQALGGMILLAIVTNLPEIAIVIGASLSNNLSIATGNILGGIAIQTVVMVILDIFGLKSEAALTEKTISLQLVLEGVFVILILFILIMGSQLPKSLMYYRVAPSDIAIIFSWIMGLWLTKKAGLYLPWQKKYKEDIRKKYQKEKNQYASIALLLTFFVLAVMILIAGFLLEETSVTITKSLGWDTLIFGATILAAITALPEISTGIAAIKLRDYTLAVSDIFGGNAFLPVLFFLMTLITGTSAASALQKSDIYLAGLGGLITSIYLCGLIFSSKKQIGWLGLDSWLVLITYFLGIFGLYFISK